MNEMKVAEEGGKILIQVAEEGVRQDTFGWSVIVCGVNGERLKPVSIPDKKLGLPHAIFEEEELVTIKADFNRISGEEKILIERHFVKSRAIKSWCLYNKEVEVLTWKCNNCGIVLAGMAKPKEHRCPKASFGIGYIYPTKIALDLWVEKYHAAVLAALEKAKCYYCTCLHFAAK